MQPASTTSRAGRAQPLSSSAEPSTTDRRTPRWHRHWRISSTAYNYARRGRGNSGDTAGHSIDREIEDLNAVIAAGGGSAHLFGASTGGALALEAAAAGVPPSASRPTTFRTA